MSEFLGTNLKYASTDRGTPIIVKVRGYVTETKFSAYTEFQNAVVIRTAPTILQSSTFKDV